MPSSRGRYEGHYVWRSRQWSSYGVPDTPYWRRLLSKYERERARTARHEGDDGAYDSRANFNFLAGEGIKPVIGVGEGAAPCRGAGDLRPGSRPS